MSKGILWFRQDLRLRDNPALAAASKACDELLCIFIDDPQEQSISQLGSASRVWLHHSLHALQSSLRTKGCDLYFAQGPSLEVLDVLVDQYGAQRIFWNRCYDPMTIERDKSIKSALADLQPRTFNALLVNEPWENLKSDGDPYRVFTPYWRAAAAAIGKDEARLQTLNRPRHIPALSKSSAKGLKCCVSLEQLELLPDKGWHESMLHDWQVGEEAAQAQVEKFLESAVNDYDEGRNLPALSGTSRLSPHLHFGEVSPRHVINRVLLDRKLSALSESETTFVKEIFWREFAYSLLFHFPQTIDEPLDPRFENFEWAEHSDDHLRRWQQGRTGVPIVDAGMRELYATGWMHNRVRMIVASYLIKNLLIPWQQGEQWFRDKLVDADLASNCMGWQWTAGCGADAAPFFRIFNPVLQGEKFDREGDYVRHWVPELAAVTKKYVHKPWELDAETRSGIDYLEPLVDLKQSRERALAAFTAIKGARTS